MDIQGDRGYIGTQGICWETGDIDIKRQLICRETQDIQVDCRYAGIQGICGETGDMK